MDVHEEDVRFYGNLPGVEDGRFAHLLPAMLRTSRDYLHRQWLGADVFEIQTSRLARCLTDAVLSVPAYRRTGITPADIAADPWSCLSRFPTLHKRDVQAVLEDYVADDFVADECFRVVTSGSTGVPLVLLQDETSYLHEAACYYRLLGAVPFEPGDRVCRIRSDPSLPTWGVTVQFLPGPMEVAVINLLQPDQSWALECVERLRAWCPVAFVGNPSDLLALSLLLQERGISLPSVRFVVSGGENLLPNTRETIESTFDCKTHDVYSLQEIRSVAWECEAGTLHVNEDRVVVQTMKETEAGPPELVITPLMNRSMQLIRYRTGDLGRFVSWQESPCPCGRQLGRIEEFSGRDRGFVVLPGHRLYGPKLIKLFLTFQPVAIWQIVQREIDRLEILLVALPTGQPPGLLSTIREGIAKLLDNQLEVRARWVQREELLGGPGKFQMMHLMSNELDGSFQLPQSTGEIV